MPSVTSRFALLSAASTMTVLLVGCSPGVLAPLPTAEAPTMPTSSETTTPSPTPAATASPTPVATPGEVGPSIPAGWVKYEVDGWASVYAPAGWGLEPVSDHPDEPSFNLVDGDGKSWLNFMYEAPGGYPVTPETCNDPGYEPSPFTMLETTSVPWALDGEDLQHALTIREVTIYHGESDGPVTEYQVASRLAEADRYEGTDCEPFSAIYPDSGGYLWVAQHGDPIESLFFATEQEALDYPMTDEYQLAKQLIQTVQLTL